MNAILSEMIGKTPVTVDAKVGDEEMRVQMSDGTAYRFVHHQDCCEGVSIESVVGDVNDLIGEPLLLAEEVTHKDENPPEVAAPEYQDSFTWTFYKFATRKGYVDVRWYGQSNGYYSESVDVERD